MSAKVGDHPQGWVTDPNEDPLKKDFRKFLWVIWDHLNLPDPTPVQYDMAQFLQHGPTRTIISAFRGVGKSWITAAYCLWLLYSDPQIKIMVVSASKERADAFSIFVKRLIHEVPLLVHLKPRAGQRDSVVAFDVGPSTPDHSPSVKSVGITGQLTGSRADVIIADDVEVPSNSATQLQRDKLSELVKEFSAILKSKEANPNARIIYLGTPQCEMSLYNTLSERGYVTRIWPAQYPSPEQRAAYGTKLAYWIGDRLDRNLARVGEAVDPKRFTVVDLQERMVEYGKSGYALQFMLDTTLSDADRYPLKLRDLVVMNLNNEEAPIKTIWAAAPELIINDLPGVGFVGDRWYRPMRLSEEWKPYTGSVLAIDPAGRGKDQTAYAVVKVLHSTLFLTAIGGFDGGYEDSTLVGLSEIARDHKVNAVIVEANFGDGMFTKLLQPILAGYHKCGIEEVKHSSQKEQRIIDTLEPVMGQHRLVVDEAAVRHDWATASDPQHSLFHQMVRITREKGALAHDDRLDALSIAVNYWVEAMAQDTDKVISKHHEALKDAQLRDFVRNCKFPRGVRKPTPKKTFGNPLGST